MENDRDFDIIIAGGGIAGLTAAAFASRKQKNILLCEKQEQAGGLMGGFEKHGFVFDCGIRALENAGTLLPMLSLLDIKPKLEKTSVIIRIANKSVVISDKEGLKNYQEMLSELFPKNTEDIKKIVALIQKTMGDMDVLYGVENPLFSPLWENPKLLFKTMLPWFLRYLATVAKINSAKKPVREVLSDITDNTALIDIVSQHFFKNSPTFFALGYFWLYKDYYYPKHSIKSVSDMIINYIEQNGGEISFGGSVEHINTLDKRITLSNGKRYNFKKLIWCCNQKKLVSIIGNKKTKNKVLSQKGSDSILTFYIGLDIPPAVMAELVGSHLFFTPSKLGLSSLEKPKNYFDMAQLFDYIESYLHNTTFEISCPSIINSSLAPPSKSGLIVGTLFSYQLTETISKLGLYHYFKDFCKQKIVEILDKTLITGLSNKVLFVDCSTPLSVEQKTGNDGGAITGWCHTSSPMPAVSGFTAIAKSITTEHPDIYQAGMWTFSPAGLPVSIITGRLAAEKALAKLKRERLHT